MSTVTESGALAYSIETRSCHIDLSIRMLDEQADPAKQVKSQVHEALMSVLQDEDFAQVGEIDLGRDCEHIVEALSRWQHECPEGLARSRYRQIAEKLVGEALVESGCLPDQDRLFMLIVDQFRWLDLEGVCQEANALITMLGGPSEAAQLAPEDLVQGLAHQLGEQIHQSLGDMLKRCPPIPMMHIALDDPNACIEDNPFVRFQSGSYPSDGCVVPDRSFFRLLDYVNVPARQYIKAVNDRLNTDLCDPDESEHAQTWRALANSMTPADPQRQPAISASDLFDVVVNADEYCHPIFVGKVPLATLLDMRPSDLLQIRGGVVGLHNSTHGSGYLADVRDTMTVSADLRFWQARPAQIDRVYGLAEEAFECEVRLKDDSQRELALSFG